MNISNNGINLIKTYEGCELIAYKCPAGIWTIGIGHTGSVDGKPINNGLTITASKASELLKEDLKSFENAINKYVTVQITQNMFDALISFTYNVGIGNFKASTLLKKLNTGDYKGAAEEFAKWNKANGVVLLGLTKRRASEKALFLNGFDSTIQSKNNDWIKNIQIIIGVTVDGLAGVETLSKIPAIKNGSKGDIAKLLQEKLTYLGYDTKGIDGDIGTSSVSAIKAFQKANKLTVDGVFGQNSWKKIFEISQ